MEFQDLPRSFVQYPPLEPPYIFNPLFLKLYLLNLMAVLRRDVHLWRLLAC